MKKVVYLAPIDYVTGKLPFKKPVTSPSGGIQGRLNARNDKGVTYATLSAIGIRDLATHPVSTDELAQRSRFGAIAALVAARRQDNAHKVTDMQNFKAQDTYKTFTKYLWAIMTVQYDESLNAEG